MCTCSRGLMEKLPAVGFIHVIYWQFEISFSTSFCLSYLQKKKKKYSNCAEVFETSVCLTSGDSPSADVWACEAGRSHKRPPWACWGHLWSRWVALWSGVQIFDLLSSLVASPVHLNVGYGFQSKYIQVSGWIRILAPQPGDYIQCLKEIKSFIWSSYSHFYIKATQFHRSTKLISERALAWTQNIKQANFSANK